MCVKKSSKFVEIHQFFIYYKGYASGLENIAAEFEKAEEEIKKIKKRFNLQAACDDLSKRQKIYNDTNKTITGTILHIYCII